MREGGEINLAKSPWIVLRMCLTASLKAVHFMCDDVLTTMLRWLKYT